MTTPVERKLTTILAADAMAYSKAMGLDEVDTVEKLRASREVFFRQIESHGGRIANTAGDGLIAEFPSVVEAVQCAIETQRELAERAREKTGLQYRIGVHLGDVIVDGEDLIGEGVNLAARLESMCEPGGVLISQQVYDQVHAKLSIGFEYLGEKRPKNLTQDVPVYRVAMGKRSAAAFRPKIRQDAPPKAGPVSGPPRSSASAAIRDARILAVACGAAIAINLFSLSPPWAQWPVLVFVTAYAMRWAPHFLSGRFSPMVTRLMVFATFLFMVNVFTWNGNFWAIWPIGVLAFAALMHRAVKR